MLAFSKAKMNFSYAVVRKGDGLVLAEGKTQNVFTNMAVKITRLTDEYYNKIASLYDQERSVTTK